jgi:hypothetical protein
MQAISVLKGSKLHSGIGRCTNCQSILTTFEKQQLSRKIKMIEQMQHSVYSKQMKRKSITDKVFDEL